MKVTNSIVRQMPAYALGITLMVPCAAVLSQCPAQTNPLKQLALGPPGHRVCCALGIAIGVEPTSLANHKYGNGGFFPQTVAAVSGGEVVGYVYTAAAGMVDIGHVRDNADMTLWVYSHLLNGEHSIAVDTATASTVNVPSIPSAKDQVLALAGAIVYMNSVAHELNTWGDTSAATIVMGGAEDFSAFSPEDLSSNIVGIEVATRAIQNGGAASAQAFNQQMNAALSKMMTELQAQSADATNAWLVQLKFKPGDKDLTGKWWMDDPYSQNSAVRLLRRNFDGAPWKIAGAHQEATPPWLNTKGFSSYYQQFVYFTKKDVDATQVPQTSAYALAPPNSTSLRWTAIPPGSIPKIAIEVDGLGGTICFTGPGNKILSNGQLGSKIKVNVYPTPDYIVGNLQDATTAIRTAFVNANSCVKDQPCSLPPGASGPMDGP